MERREITFRAWDEKGKQFYTVFWTLYGWDFKDEKSMPVFVKDWNTPVIWMQYTGIKDKLGKDIYEGDILSGFKISVIVEFSEGAFRVTCDDFKFVLTNADIDLHDMEVIGNIYENPELLEKD